MKLFSSARIWISSRYWNVSTHNFLKEIHIPIKMGLSVNQNTHKHLIPLCDLQQNLRMLENLSTFLRFLKYYLILSAPKVRFDSKFIVYHNILLKIYNVFQETIVLSKLMGKEYCKQNFIENGNKKWREKEHESYMVWPDNYIFSI